MSEATELAAHQRTHGQFPALTLCSSQPLLPPWASTYMCHAHTETHVCMQMKINLNDIFSIKNLHCTYREKRITIFLISQAHRDDVYFNLLQVSGKTLDLQVYVFITHFQVLCALGVSIFLLKLWLSLGFRCYFSHRTSLVDEPIHSFWCVFYLHLIFFSI